MVLIAETSRMNGETKLENQLKFWDMHFCNPSSNPFGIDNNLGFLITPIHKNDYNWFEFQYYFGLNFASIDSNSIVATVDVGIYIFLVRSREGNICKNCYLQ